MSTSHKLHSFASTTDAAIPTQLNDPFVVQDKQHPLVSIAVAQLQQHLKTQTEWQHNFGLQGEDTTLKPISKMFGVLVLQTADKKLGYVAAFSGKLASQNHHSYFVPPVFDSLSADTFLNKGMLYLKVINDEIKTLELADDKA